MGAFGLLDRDLDGAGLLDFARRRCRLHGFGDDAVTAPLRVLLQSCSREASLSLVGRAAARWDMQRFLSNLARMAEEEAARPGIRGEPIEAPIFVTGLPRSGTNRGSGLNLSTTTTQRIARLVEREPRGGYGQNQDSFEDYGLDPAQERRRFQPYVEHFRVALEYDAGPRMAGPARRLARPFAPAHGVAPTA